MLLVKENEVNQQPMQSISIVTKTEPMSTTTSIMGEVKAKTENTTSIKTDTKTEDDGTAVKAYFEEGDQTEEYLLKGLAGKMPIRVQMVDYRLLGVVLLTSLPMLLVDM